MKLMTRRSLQVIVALGYLGAATSTAWAQDDESDDDTVAPLDATSDSPDELPSDDAVVPSEETATPADEATVPAEETGATAPAVPAELSGTTIVLGIGRTSLGGDMKDFGAPAWQWGFNLSRAVYPIVDKLTLGVAFDFRYSKHERDLDAMRIGNTDAQSSVKRYDFALLADLRYSILNSLAVFTDLGPSYQTRTLYIQADSGDDYYRNNAFGYLWRLGAQYSCATSVGNVVGNLVYAMTNGGARDSGRLKYNLDTVNYNGPASTFGIELGLAL